MERSVLLLDDDAYFRKAMVSELEKAGYRVIDVGTAHAADAVLSAERPQLLIVDGKLTRGAGADGAEWIAKVRGRDTAIPVLFVSSLRPGAALRKRLLEDLGVAQLLEKPIQPAALVSVVRGLIGASRSDRPPPGPDAMAALQSAYRKALPLEISSLGQVFQRCRSGDAATVDEAIAIAHRLRGNAALYGFSEIGELAAFVEEQLRDDPNPNWGAMRDAIERATVLALQEPGEAAFDSCGVQRLTSSSGRGPRVLVIEDDEAFYSYVEVVLERNGMSVSTLQDPSRVREVLDRVRPDLILLDVRMRGMNGFEVCRLIRATPAFAHVPIVFVSADADPQSRLAAFRAGGDDYVIKPVSEDELMARLAAKLRKRA